MKVLTREWVKKAEADIRVAKRALSWKPIFSDQVCFLCQQSAEKYLKALLQELGVRINKTHDIKLLVNQLVPVDKTLTRLRSGAKTLTRYAVQYRYPGVD